MDKSSDIFSQEFNFKEAEEAPDDQLEMRDVYFNVMGSSRLSINNQLKKKPKKQNTANFIRDQIEKASKIKEKEMNEQKEQITKNQYSFNNTTTANNNNKNNNIQNGQQYYSSTNSDVEQDEQQKTPNNLTNQQQYLSSRLTINKPQYQSGIQSSSNQIHQQSQQQKRNYSPLNQNLPQQTANNIFEQQNNLSNYQTNGFQSNKPSNIQQKDNNKSKVNNTKNTSNESSSSEQDYQDVIIRNSLDRGNISSGYQNPSKIQQNTLTQINNNSKIQQQKQSQLKIGATCVQNKKNKKRRLGKTIIPSNNQQSSNMSQIYLGKRNKPFYSANKSSQSSQGEIDDDVEEDHNSTLTQKFQNKSQIPHDQLIHSNQFTYQQQVNQQQQLKFNQQFNQQQRSQDQNDTSDLSPSISHKPANKQYIYNELHLLNQDSSIQSSSFKQNLKCSSSSLSNESEIEEFNSKIQNQQFNNKSSSQFFQNMKSSLTVDRDLPINQLKMKSNKSVINNEDNLETHILAAANMGNNQNIQQYNLSDKKIVSQSPSRILLESGIKKNQLTNNNIQNQMEINTNNNQKNGRIDYYQKEKFIKSIEGDQSIITVRIENVSLKPFQTVIAEIISVDRINTQLISFSLKPSQLIHAILKQSYSMQTTLKVGGEYIFKFQTLENSSHLPIINVNEYIPR